MESMLEAAGLSPRSRGADAWTCVLSAGGRRVSLAARRTPNWLVLETEPLAPAPAAERRAEVHRALLAANRQLPLVRFAIGPAGEPHLRAELPTASLQAPEVAAVADSLRAGLARLDALLAQK
jgi:putative sensory transduction regulator